jgi:hypothetical protein
VTPVIIKGAIVLPHAPSKVSRRTTRVHCIYKNPELPANATIFSPRKGAEVPDLNALELCKTWGFSGKFHIKSMFLGQNKYIYERFGDHLDTINTPTQSGVLRMRLIASTGVLTEVMTFSSDRRINGF